MSTTKNQVPQSLSTSGKPLNEGGSIVITSTKPLYGFVQVPADYVTVVAEVVTPPQPGNRANLATVKLRSSGVQCQIAWSDLQGPSGKNMPKVGDVVCANGLVSASSPTTGTITILLHNSGNSLSVTAADCHGSQNL